MKKKMKMYLLIDQMNDLFDIAHQSELKIIKIE